MEIVYTPLNEGKPEIYPTTKPKIRWEDLILLYGTRISASNTSPGDDEYVNIYIVPEGKVFFMLSAHLTVANNSTVRRAGKIFIRRPGETDTSTRCMMIINTMPQGQSSTSINPTVPILVLYGESVGIFNEDPLVTTMGQVVGYEIETNLFQTLF